MKMKYILAGLAALIMSSGAAQAQVVFNLPDDDTTTIYSGEFNGLVEGSILEGLTAEIAFQLVSKVDDVWTISFELWNTSTVNSTITLFAFDSAPDIIGATTGDDWDVFVFNDSLPGNNAVELCIKEAGNDNNCNSGQLGIDADNHAAFTIAFQVADAGATVLTLDNFWVRYQSVGPDFEDSGIGTMTFIPEPATWVMMILGFAGIAQALKYRRRHVYAALAPLAA